MCLTAKAQGWLASKDRQEGVLERPLTHGQRGLVWEDPSGAKRCFQREAEVGEESKKAWSEGKRQPHAQAQGGAGMRRNNVAGSQTG